MEIICERCGNIMKTQEDISFFPDELICECPLCENILNNLEVSKLRA